MLISLLNELRFTLNFNHEHLWNKISLFNKRRYHWIKAMESLLTSITLYQFVPRQKVSNKIKLTQTKYICKCAEKKTSSKQIQILT